MSKQEIPEMHYCVIGGTGRSGTTVLRRVMSRHPTVATVPEWRMTVDPDGIVDFYSSLASNWSPFNYHVKLERLLALLRGVGTRRRVRRRAMSLWRRFPAFGARGRHAALQYERVNITRDVPDYHRYVDELEKKLTEIEFSGSWYGMPGLSRRQMTYSIYPIAEQVAQPLGEFLVNLASDVCKSNSASAFCEKNTWNILFFDKLLQLVPQAKLVHIHRDPRDVVASFVKQPWMPSDAVKAARVYCSLIARWDDVRRSVPTASYKETSLEELASDPRRTLADLCEFWSLPWDNAVLDVPLNKANTGRWKRDFSPEIQAQLTQTLSVPLERLGYE